MEKPTRKPIEVEDLLRLKRSEMPDEAFWESFGEKLNQRMVHEAVKKYRPSFKSIIRYCFSKTLAWTPMAAACLTLMGTLYILVENKRQSSGEIYGSRFVTLSHEKDLSAFSRPSLGRGNHLSNIIYVKGSAQNTSRPAHFSSTNEHFCY